MRIKLLMLASAAALACGPASATTTITVSGTFGGSLAGQVFDPQTLTFVGTSDVEPNTVFGYSYVLDGLTVTSGLTGSPFSLALGQETRFTSFLGVFDQLGQLSDVLFAYETAGGADGELTYASTRDFATSAGALRITSGTAISTSVAESGAVPEPATWATMMLGFGGLAHAMRRRIRVSARVTYA